MAATTGRSLTLQNTSLYGRNKDQEASKNSYMIPLNENEITLIQAENQLVIIRFELVTLLVLECRWDIPDKHHDYWSA